MRSISPANIFPNNLKVKLTTLVNSPKNSRIPTNELIGPLLIGLTKNLPA